MHIDLPTVCRLAPAVKLLARVKVQHRHIASECQLLPRLFSALSLPGLCRLQHGLCRLCRLDWSAGMCLPCLLVLLLLLLLLLRLCCRVRAAQC